MPEFVLVPPRVGDNSLFAPLFHSPVVDRAADAIVRAGADIGEFFDPEVLTLQLTGEPAPFIIWGPDIQPPPKLLPMWTADP